MRETYNTTTKSARAISTKRGRENWQKADIMLTLIARNARGVREREEAY
jgi:hypothetical protein